MRYLIAAVCLLTSSSLSVQFTPGSPATTVRIAGHVIDKDGHAVADATVAFFPFSGRGGMATFALDTQTDAKGDFSFAVPPLGDGWLRAMKFDSGYPDFVNGLYGRGGNDKNNGSITLISAKQGSPVTGLTLQFGEPDAVIDWTVRSEADRSLLPNGRYKIALSDEPTTFQSASFGADAHFIFVLPQRPVIITIAVPGYRDWSSAGDANFGDRFMLKPGSRQRRDIYLKKADLAIAPGAMK